MKRRFLFLLLFVLLSVCALQAEPVCPWLTQGSAAALLGGNVSAVIKLSPAGEGSCVFSLEQEGTTYSLEIIVGSTPRITCPPASPKVPGIGNEAVSCRLQRSLKETVEVVSSRVRAVYFSTNLTIQGTTKPGISINKQRDIVERAAEQVAGNLD